MPVLVMERPRPPPTPQSLQGPCWKHIPVTPAYTYIEVCFDSDHSKTKSATSVTLLTSKSSSSNIKPSSNILALSSPSPSSSSSSSSSSSPSSATAEHRIQIIYFFYPPHQKTRGMTLQSQCRLTHKKQRKVSHKIVITMSWTHTIIQHQSTSQH